MIVVDRTDLAECAGEIGRGMRDRRRGPPSRIVIHRNTASSYWLDRHPEKSGMSHVELLHDFHTHSSWKFRLFPYHYFIDRDGAIYKIHDEMTVTPHAPNRGNWRSIGIALNFDGRTETLNAEAEAALLWLCRDILKRWPSCDIMGHSPLKRCPGPLIDVSAIDEKVRGPKTGE